MPFTIPDFPLTVNIFTGIGAIGVPRVVTVGNLSIGRAVRAISQGFNPLEVLGYNPHLLLPAGTDIRDAANVTGEDTVEVPAGTGRFYTVCGVDDIGKGFPNEHRFAVLYKRYALGGSFPGEHWPTPVP